MGNLYAKTSGLCDALFSKTQKQVLGLLFGQPERSFYSKEIVDLAGVGTGTVHRELEKLQGAGLLRVKKVGNQKHFQANPTSPIFEELKGIVRKTFGVADLVKSALAPFENQIDVAFIYGSIASGSDTAGSDVDLMVISDHLSYSDLLENLAEVESKIGRSVNPTIYSTEEYQSRLMSNNNFITSLAHQPLILLIGTKHDIPTV